MIFFCICQKKAPSNKRRINNKLVVLFYSEQILAHPFIMPKNLYQNYRAQNRNSFE